MKNLLKPSATLSFAARTGLPLAGFRLLAALTLLLAAVGVVPLLVSQGQKLDAPVKVSKVASWESNHGTVVSIAADGLLVSAQTWQDNEGYHVVLPNSVPVDSLKVGRGVKVRRVGNSMELLLQTEPGTRVSVQPGPNPLTFVIDGALEGMPMASGSPAASSSSQNRTQNENLTRQPLSTGENFNSGPSDAGIGHAPGADKGAPSLIGPNDINQQGNNNVPDSPASEIRVQGQDDGLLASVFSGTSVLIVISLGLFGLLVSRRLRTRQASEDSDDAPSEKTGGEYRGVEGTNASPGNSPSAAKGMGLMRSSEATPTPG